MKKFSRIIAVIAAAVIGFLAGAVGMRMCGSGSIDSPIETDIDDGSDYYDMYGCPNSRRVKKLNLLKSRRTL